MELLSKYTAGHRRKYNWKCRLQFCFCVNHERNSFALLYVCMDGQKHRSLLSSFTNQWALKLSSKNAETTFTACMLQTMSWKIFMENKWLMGSCRIISKYIYIKMSNDKALMGHVRLVIEVPINCAVHVGCMWNVTCVWAVYGTIFLSGPRGGGGVVGYCVKSCYEYIITMTGFKLSICTHRNDSFIWTSPGTNYQFQNNAIFPPNIRGIGYKKC